MIASWNTLHGKLDPDRILEPKRAPREDRGNGPPGADHRRYWNSIDGYRIFPHEASHLPWKVAVFFQAAPNRGPSFPLFRSGALSAQPRNSLRLSGGRQGCPGMRITLRRGRWFAGKCRLSRVESEVVLCALLNGIVTIEDLQEIHWPDPDDMPDIWLGNIRKRLCCLRKKLSPYTLAPTWAGAWRFAHMDDAAIGPAGYPSIYHGGVLGTGQARDQRAVP